VHSGFLYVGDFHGILDVVLPFFIELSVEVILYIAKAILELFVDFADDIVEEVIAELFKQMRNLV
jgi:hypothetical protein